MVSLANSNMQLVSIRQQIASAVHVLVQASRQSDGTRRVVNRSPRSPAWKATW
jgi:pilus assembly protein CpaF